MKSNGSVYVSVVFATLIAYFAYQWWFNPNRAIKRRLGEVAVALSVPANDAEIGRVARIAQLRGYFAGDVHVRVGTASSDITSREALLAAVSAWNPPPGGWDVNFVDVQVALVSDSSARAYLTAEMVGHDARTGEATYDSRDATVTLARRDGEWVISEVEAHQARD